MLVVFSSVYAFLSPLVLKFDPVLAGSILCAPATLSITKNNSTSVKVHEFNPCVAKKKKKKKTKKASHCYLI